MGAIPVSIILIAGGLSGVVGLSKQSIANIVAAGNDPTAGLGLCEDIAGGVVAFGFSEHVCRRCEAYNRAHKQQCGPNMTLTTFVWH